MQNYDNHNKQSLSHSIRIKKLTSKPHNYMEPEQPAPNDYLVNNKIKTEINKFFETNKNKDTTNENFSDTAKGAF